MKILSLYKPNSSQQVAWFTCDNISATVLEVIRAEFEGAFKFGNSKSHLIVTPAPSPAELKGILSAMERATKGVAEKATVEAEKREQGIQSLAASYGLVLSE